MHYRIQEITPSVFYDYDINFLVNIQNFFWINFNTTRNLIFHIKGGSIILVKILKKSDINKLLKHKIYLKQSNYFLTEICAKRDSSLNTRKSLLNWLSASLNEIKFNYFKCFNHISFNFFGVHGQI